MLPLSGLAIRRFWTQTLRTDDYSRNGRLNAAKTTLVLTESEQVKLSKRHVEMVLGLHKQSLSVEKTDQIEG